jgi:SAM-dependent methyltransferase
MANHVDHREDRATNRGFQQERSRRRTDQCLPNGSTTAAWMTILTRDLGQRQRAEEVGEVVCQGMKLQPHRVRGDWDAPADIHNAGAIDRTLQFSQQLVGGSLMADALSFRAEAAAEYDRAFQHVSAHFLPFLLRAARLAPGQRVLDVATGTGISAEAALRAVGPGGSILATDISPEMVEKARQRLAQLPNAAVAIEDGQALTLPEASFDAVLCSLGLMFFPDPARGLASFHRVLRPGGRAAVSVKVAPERSYNFRINVVIARHRPSLADAIARLFALGGESRLKSLFGEAGFVDFETSTVKHSFVLPSFDAYYGPFERGGASTGQLLASLPEAVRHAVREEMRQALDTGGPITIEVEHRIASGERKF